MSAERCGQRERNNLREKPEQKKRGEEQEGGRKLSGKNQSPSSNGGREGRVNHYLTGLPKNNRVGKGSIKT